MKKMPERMITQYQRWVFDKEKKENVENLRSFTIQEAEFQMAAAETIHSLHRIGNKAKIDHTKIPKEVCILHLRSFIMGLCSIQTA